MQNVGSYDADFAMFLFCVMMFPIVISIITNIVKNFLPSQDEDVSPNVIGFDDTPTAIIEAEFKFANHPKQKSSPQNLKTSNDIINEVQNSLCGLGFKKSKTSIIIKNLCSKRHYKTAEDLLKDAVMCI